jgi:(5-formylfuran-3-yl)methyl phosphate synthase
VPLSPHFFRRLPRAKTPDASTTRRPGAPIPALLVSVRNPLEARAAVAGGCDLLDIKEPNRGALGMADRDVMAAIAQYAATCRESETPLPCSAALGELVDWTTERAEFSLPPGIDYVKLGAAHIDSAARWLEAWQEVRRRLDTVPQRGLRWVAVAYADWQTADSLEPSHLLEVARTAGCDVMLIDTFDKSAGNLLKLMGLAELRRLSDSAHQAGLKFALAGSLRRAQCAELIEVRPDILGVRGAACAGGRRTSPVSAKAVRALKRELLARFATDGEPAFDV